MIDWRHWHNEPLLVGGLILAGWLYALLVGPLRGWFAPGVALDRRRAWCFGGSIVIFYLAVGSPLDQVGELFLLSGHMVQHILIIYLAPLLWMLGLPAWLVDPVLGRTPVRAVGRILLHPLCAGIIYSLVTSVWHAPELYDWALRDRLVHVLEHVMFFWSGLVYWWPILSPSRELPPARLPVQMFYLFGTMVGLTPVFAYITFSKDILYPTYEYAPRLIAGFSAADDQLLAGIIMKASGLAITLLTFAWIFWKWSRAAETPSRARITSEPAPPAATPRGLS